jgi:Flp pilus assembly protein TadD
MALSRLGMEELADPAFTELSKLDAGVATTAAYRAGFSLFKTDFIDGTIASFERVLTVVPDHAETHHQLGLCYANKGDTNKAREHLEKLLELAPNDPAAGQVMGMIETLR